MDQADSRTLLHPSSQPSTRFPQETPPPPPQPAPLQPSSLRYSNTLTLGLPHNNNDDDDDNNNNNNNNDDDDDNNNNNNNNSNKFSILDDDPAMESSIWGETNAIAEVETMRGRLSSSRGLLGSGIKVTTGTGVWDAVDDRVGVGVGVGDGDQNHHQRRQDPSAAIYDSPCNMNSNFVDVHFQTTPKKNENTNADEGEYDEDAPLGLKRVDDGFYEDKEYSQRLRKEYELKDMNRSNKTSTNQFSSSSSSSSSTAATGVATTATSFIRGVGSMVFGHDTKTSGHDEATFPSSSSSSRPSWLTLSYYLPYFEVDIYDVQERIFGACTAIGNHRIIAPQADNKTMDLYGPLWITSTLILLLSVASSLHQFLAAFIIHSNNNYYNINPTVADQVRKLTLASSTLYLYVLLMPAALCLFSKYFARESPGLVHSIAVYGYALAPWIPCVALTAVVPVVWWTWLMIATAWLMSSLTIYINLFAQGGDQEEEGYEAARADHEAQSTTTRTKTTTAKTVTYDSHGTTDWIQHDEEQQQTWIQHACQWPQRVLQAILVSNNKVNVVKCTATALHLLLAIYIRWVFF